MDLEKTKSLLRSKLYLLDDETEWIDKGIGFPSIEKTEGKYILRFKIEDPEKEVYYLEIKDYIFFEHREDKIIAWHNEKTEENMALSFQNEEGAQIIWNSIEEMKEFFKEQLFESLPPVRLDSTDSNFLFECFEHDLFSEENSIFPVPNINNLSKILSELTSITSLEKKINISNLITSKKIYIDKLKEIFTEAEKNDDRKTLDLLYCIMRNIISLSEHELLDYLMSDENYLFVFGVLEYDPDMIVKSKTTHRNHFKQIANFQEIGEIKEKEIIRWIHINYRLLYLRDCALGHFLDERALNLITIIVYNLYAEIIKYLHSNKDFLISFFDNLRNHNIMALKMINEIFNIIKITDVDKIEIISIFNEFNIFETLEEMLKDQNSQKEENSYFSKYLPKTKFQQKTKKKISSDIETYQKNATFYILDTITISLQLAPFFFRNFIVSQNQKFLKYPFLNLITENLISNSDLNLRGMYGDLLKLLIENNQNMNDSTILDVFIDNFLLKMLKIFDDNTENEEKVVSKQILLEILIFNLRNIHNKLKEFLINYKDLSKLFQPIENARNKPLIISCLQLFKHLLFTKIPELITLCEEPLKIIFKYFLKQSLKRQNLLFSTILEIFKHIYEDKQINMNLVNIIESESRKVPPNPLHSFMDLQFYKYKVTSPSKSVDIPFLQLDSHSNFYSSNMNKEFLLDNVEGDSHQKNDLKKTNFNIKPKNNTLEGNKLVNYDDEIEINEIEYKKIKLDDKGSYAKINIMKDNHFK